MDSNQIITGTMCGIGFGLATSFLGITPFGEGAVLFWGGLLVVVGLGCRS